MIIRKQKIIPIIPPCAPRIIGTQHRFQYTNPAVHVRDGSFVGVIRLVSYMKFPDQSFETWVYPAQSLYISFRGELERPDDWVFSGILPVDYGDKNTHATHWVGVEDIRFLSHDRVVACVPELSSHGLPGLLTARFDPQEGLTEFQRLFRFQEMEKNWMPFDDGRRFIYSVHPLRVYEPSVSDEPVILPYDGVSMEGYHGSTNGEAWAGGWLFLVHKGGCEHRFLHLVAGSTRVSGPFRFFRESHIEFPCSLSFEKGLFYIAMGINDEAAFIVCIHPSDIIWEPSEN